MAFPVYVNEQETIDAAPASGTITYTLPSSIVADNLLILIAHARTTSSVTTPTGWTALTSSMSWSQYRFRIWYRQATGSDTNPDVVYAGTPAEIAGKIIQISNWDTAQAPEATQDGTPGLDTSANPPSHTATWGAGDNGVIAVGSWADDEQTIVAYPAGYTNTHLTTVGTGSNDTITMATAFNTVTTATEDPGIFDFPNNESQISATIMFLGGAGAGGVVPQTVHHYTKNLA